MPHPNSVTEMWNHIFWSYFMGGATVLLGLFLIAYPLVTAALTTVLFGGVLIFAGIAQFVFALHSQAFGGVLLKVLRSGLFGIAGGWLVLSPRAGVETLAGVLVAMLLAGAGVEGVMALVVQPLKGWKWFLCDATASFLVGILILSGWPASSVWAIGALVGGSVLMSGICRIKIASRMRSRLTPPVPREYRKAA
jgi:uncharacterized membrane protein HdeD (DUF308 family)